MAASSQPTFAVQGEYTESATAELADLSFRLVTEMDSDAQADLWLQQNINLIVGKLQRLAPGLPGSTKPGQVFHPTPDSAPILSYTISKPSSPGGYASSSLSKVNSSLISVSSRGSVKKRVSAGTTISVTFTNVGVLESFANEMAPTLVQLDSIVWRLTMPTARRVRRAARTGAVTEAYERAWDLAYASLSTIGTVPPDTPNATRVPQAPVFTLAPLQIVDASSATAPVLSHTRNVRTISKGSGPNDVAVDRDAFEPPLLKLSVKIDAKYTVTDFPRGNS